MGIRLEVVTSADTYCPQVEWDGTGGDLGEVRCMCRAAFQVYREDKQFTCPFCGAVYRNPGDTSAQTQPLHVITAEYWEGESMWLVGTIRCSGTPNSGK